MASIAAERSEALEELTRGLDPEQIRRFTSSLEFVADHAARRVLESSRREIGYTKESAALVPLLAARSGESNEEVLYKALQLYQVVLDYAEKGDRLAILDPEDTIVREIEGIGRARSAGPDDPAGSVE